MEPSLEKHQPSLWKWAQHSILLLGTMMAIFVALSNTLNWHLQLVWGASADFWQSQWDRFLLAFGDDQFRLRVVGTNVLTTGLYWVVGSIYMLMDIYNWPQWIRKYKVQPKVNEPVDTTRLFKALKQVLFNQLFVTLPMSIVSFYLMKWGDLLRPVHVLPSFHEVLIELAILIVIEEIGFYYAHRMFHHPMIYKHIHKKHHEWTAPVALMAVYCHPLEHLVANLLPPAIGVVLLNSHLATTWLWLCSVIVVTLNDHSGYHLPFMVSPEAHDYHHLKFNQCYGVLGILDYLHGTDGRFRASPSGARHVILRSFSSARDTFPDSLKEKS